MPVGNLVRQKEGTQVSGTQEHPLILHQQRVSPVCRPVYLSRALARVIPERLVRFGKIEMFEKKTRAYILSRRESERAPF